MPSIKDLKKRITSVKNTQQTTRAMKMVSAAKLRRAQEAITSQRPYARRVDQLIRRLSTMTEGKYKSRLLGIEADGPVEKRVLLVIVTSDRGLCGGFNGNVIKATQRWIRTNSDKYAEIELGFVGRRGYDFFKTKRVKVGTYYSEIGGKVTFAKARQLAELLTEAYLAEKYTEIKFVYNEFKNAVTQKVVVESFLPLQGMEAEETSAKSEPEVSADYIVRPSAPEMMEILLSKHFAIQAFRILLESQASEHGARMSAMENATKNAGEMIRKLTLVYNKQRQASITKELLEIISGSESQKAEA